MSIDEIIIENIKEILKEKYNVSDDIVMLEIPKDNTKGDYASNIAMRLTKILKRKPVDIANELKEELLNKCKEIESIDIAGPGFINFWVKKSSLASNIKAIIELDKDYGKSDTYKGIKVIEEYVSANPTGQLHCGHARGAVWGDSSTRIMKAAGYDVTREYYINDAGHQIDMLGESLYGRYLEAFGKEFTLPDDGYHGQDVKEIALEIKNEVGDKLLNMPKDEAVSYLKVVGREKELDRIKKDLAYYGCEFDSYLSEKWLVDTGMVQEAIDKMKAKDLLYEKDGAIWFKASLYGDEKDRVLKKTDGFYTYMTSDIAYHAYKYDRGYDLIVNIWGADHHGYIPRMKGAMKALGYDESKMEIDICQMVRMVEDGKEVKMSKRTGNAITLRELIDDVGLDSTRFLFLSKALDTHLDFDFTLAKKKSNENPVYYVQYAYARMCSILAQGNLKTQNEYTLLTNEKEIDLLKHISSMGDVVVGAAKERAPHKICNYVIKLAQYFHSFYNVCKVNDPSNPELSNERLALVKASSIVLRNCLELLGVSAPEKM